MKWFSEMKGACFEQKNFDKVLCQQCYGCQAFNMALPASTHDHWDDFARNWVQLEERIELDDLAYHQRILGEKAPYPHCLITISLPPTLTPNDCKVLHNAIFPKRFNYKYMEEWGYCFEFTGHDMKWHPHLHFLRKGKAPKGSWSRIIRDFSRLFKVKEQFVDKAPSTCKKTFDIRLNYLKGIKSEDKMAQVQRDRIIRKELDIEDYYLFNI